MKIRPLVALDIGSTKVACAIGLPHEHSTGFELLGSSLVPYPLLSESWLSDPLMVSRTIEQALEATAVNGSYDRAVVAVNPPTLTSEHVQAAIPLGDEPITVRAQDVDRLQRGALQQVLGVDREALFVERLACAGNGFQGVRDPRGLSATRLVGTFHVLTIPMAARRALVQAVESAGLEVARLTYTLPAILASLADERLLQQRVLVIDAGGLSIDVGLFVEGGLHAVRIVPGGGVTLTTQIAKECGVTMEQALVWSLEGIGCRKTEVRPLIEAHWARLEDAIDMLLEDQPRPDVTLLSGRAALGDGFVEWLEHTVGMKSVLCRSGRTSAHNDLVRQLGLSTAIGLLEMTTRQFHGTAVHAPRPLNRLIDRTRAILTEYF